MTDHASRRRSVFFFCDSAKKALITPFYSFVILAWLTALTTVVEREEASCWRLTDHRTIGRFFILARVMHFAIFEVSKNESLIDKQLSNCGLKLYWLV